MLDNQTKQELRRLLRDDALHSIKDALLIFSAVESLKAKDKAVSELLSKEPSLIRAVRYACESYTYSNMLADLERIIKLTPAQEASDEEA